MYCKKKIIQFENVERDAKRKEAKGAKVKKKKLKKIFYLENV